MTEPINDWTRRTTLVAFGVSGVAALASAAGASVNSTERLSLERAIEALRVAMLAGDGKALDALLHDDLSYMHSSGHVQTKQDVMSDLAGKRFFASLAYSNSTIKITHNVGVVTLVVDQVKNLPDGGTRPSRLNVMQIWLNTRRTWKLLARLSALVPPAAPIPGTTSSEARRTS
jgi:hypothetical protein